MNSSPPPLPAGSAPAYAQTLEAALSQPVRSGGQIVRGTEGMTLGQVEDDILEGGRFTIFLWNFSLVVLSFRRGSPLTYVRSDEWAGPKALLWSIPSLLVGWWGIPWGLIFTITSLFHNCRGGKNVTSVALTTLVGPQRAASIVTRARKKSPDPVLWLLRLICLAIPVALILSLASAISEHAPAHRR